MALSKKDAPGNTADRPIAAGETLDKDGEPIDEVDAAVLAGTEDDVRNHEPRVEDLSPGQYAEAKVGPNEAEPGSEEARQHGERFQAAKMEQRLGTHTDYGKPADSIKKEK